MTDPHACARFSLVVDPASAAEMAGVPFTEWAACAVDGETAEFFFASTASELLERIGDCPVTPSMPGVPTALPDYEREMLAIALLSDEIYERASRVPLGFAPGYPRQEGGLRARLTPYGLDVLLDLAAAASLGWRRGDRVCLSQSGDGRLVALSRGPGPKLVEHAEFPDCLTVEHDLLGLPLHAALEEGSWVTPCYENREGSLVFGPPAVEAAGKSEPPATVTQAAPAQKPSRSLAAIAAVAVASAAAGFMAAALWL